MTFNTYEFELEPLHYDYAALEPFIDAETMYFHHDKHLKTYVDNLNEALKNYPELQKLTLVDLILNYNSFPEDVRDKIRNNAGGVFNHNLFFNIMGPPKGEQPIGAFMNDLLKYFGTFEAFKKELKNAALNRFGSGWGWLVMDDKCGLKVISTANQDSPLNMNLCPILPLDVWEHAYYLKYQNRRSEYIDNWFNVVDWSKVNENYLYCLKCASCI